jgi:hypothetical protein
MLYLFLGAAAAAAAAITTVYITKRKYPEQVKQFQIKAAWYSLKTYCFLEQTAIRLTKPIRLLFRKVIAIEPKCIVFINAEGNEIVRHTETEFKQLNKLQKGLDYTFILYEFALEEEEEDSDGIKELKNKYARHMLLFDDHLKVTNNFKISSDKVKLLGIQLKFRLLGEKYNIKFNFGDDNYYIVGNKLFTRPYLNWLLKRTNSLVNLSEDTHYSISFIDHKMQCIELTHTQYIVIEEEGYRIMQDKDDNDQEESTSF